MSKKILGLDLGTTNSSFASLDDYGQSQPISNREGDLVTRTAIFFDGEQRIIGKEAEAMALVNPECFISNFKRVLAKPNPDGSFEKVSVGGKDHDIAELIAIFTTEMKKQTQEAVGCEFHGVVITVPAQFGDPARRKIVEAGKLAGFDVLRVINEPTAAGIAYGARSKKEQTIMVFDFGGGTLDVSILHVTNGNIDVLGTHGVAALGGEDFTNRLMDIVKKEFEKKGVVLKDSNDKALLIELRDRVEKFKRSLSVRGEATLIASAKGKDISMTLTRDQFEEITKDLLDEAAKTPQDLLRDLKLGWDDINTIILVGGASRMPAVARRLKEISGKEPSKDINPDTCVAQGAALDAGMALAEQGERASSLSGKELPLPKGRKQDVTAFGLGCSVVDKTTNQERNVVIIPKNTSIPAKKKDTFGLHFEGQTECDVKVLQGENGIPAAQCVEIYSISLGNLPPGPVGEERIEVEYAYDVNGVIHVNVKDRISGKNAKGEFKHKTNVA